MCKVQQYTIGQESQQKLVLTKRDQCKIFVKNLATLIKTPHGVIIHNHQMISLSCVHDGKQEITSYCGGNMQKILLLAF